MPVYVYKFVDTGETVEVQQSFTDEPLKQLAHPATGDVMAVKKVFTPVGVAFKGDGFYKTDSRSPKTAKKAAAAAGESSGAASEAAASSGNGATSSEAKTPASTTSTTAGGSSAASPNTD